MDSDDLKQTISHDAASIGFSIDSANPKYRQFVNSDGILEYTVHGEEITVDWVCGRNAVLMIQAVLHHEGETIRRVSGYVTNKLGAAPDAVLRRLGIRLAQQLSGKWSSTIERIEGRRYLVLIR